MDIYIGSDHGGYSLKSDILCDIQHHNLFNKQDYTFITEIITSGTSYRQLFFTSISFE